MTCRDCQIITRLPTGPGRLFLAPFLFHTLKALEARLLARGHEVDNQVEGVLGIAIQEGGLNALSGLLRECLSEAEMRDCQAVILPEGQTLGLEQLPRTQSLHTLLARAGGDWLVDIIDSESFLFHYQPIVHTQRPGEVFGYEALMRGMHPSEPGLIPPGRMLDQARAAQLIFQLDRAARINAIRQSVAHGLKTNVFINFNPSSIYDPAYCLKTTQDEVHRLNSEPGRFVFEVVETDDVADSGHLQRIVDFYRKSGFRVALDDLSTGYASLQLLAELQPDFVKFSHAIVKGVHEDPMRQKMLRKLIELAADMEIATIAEGVETRGEWDWLRAHGVDYVQGYLFARPASPPPLPSLASLSSDS